MDHGTDQEPQQPSPAQHLTQAALMHQRAASLYVEAAADARKAGDHDRAAGYEQRAAQNRTQAAQCLAPAVTGYVCCNQPMRRDGNQLVCGKCGAWTDPGTAPQPRLAVTA
ncbi:hypothetical protein [Streptomyces pactum]|uniref:hypothetical protein n=1 Tax=Streptomyces pactum TaxID=68249 RepID=UPI000A9D6163|nr:hypothetical protein [Streptomyces pactum]